MSLGKNVQSRSLHASFNQPGRRNESSLVNVKRPLKSKKYIGTHSMNYKTDKQQVHLEFLMHSFTQGVRNTISCLLICLQNYFSHVICVNSCLTIEVGRVNPMNASLCLLWGPSLPADTGYDGCYLVLILRSRVIFEYSLSTWCWCKKLCCDFTF